MRPRPQPPTGLSDRARAYWDAVPAYAEADVPAAEDLAGWRAHAAEADARVHWGDEPVPAIATTDERVAGVRTFVLQPDGADPAGPVFLELHGGAWLIGGGDHARLAATGVARVAGTTTWAVDYRLTPDHPFPAALDDCVAVYRELLARRDPADVVVGGTSAGGNLAAALLVRARDEGLPLPSATVLVSPVLDLTLSGDTHATLLGVDVLGSLAPAIALYAQGNDLTHPLLSPLFADVRGWPPTFLQAGTRDTLLSDAVRMHRRLRDAGVDAELYVSEGMPHGGLGGAPEDEQLRQAIGDFLTRHRPA